MDRQGKKTLATEMRHRLTVQTLVEVDDGAGGFEETWIDEDDIWGAVYPMSAKRVDEYKSINVDATHMVKVRGTCAIGDTSYKQRFRFDGRDFDVLTVENAQERDVVKWVTCKENRGSP
jgi:SPP1 family predicted phage head-tail adaptor